MTKCGAPYAKKIPHDEMRSPLGTKNTVPIHDEMGNPFWPKIYPMTKCGAPYAKKIPRDEMRSPLCTKNTVPIQTQIHS